jgi:hypothetical protein
VLYTSNLNGTFIKLFTGVLSGATVPGSRVEMAAKLIFQTNKNDFERSKNVIIVPSIKKSSK